MTRFGVYKDSFGSALPVIEGDELDVTSPQIPTPTPEQPKHAEADLTPHDVPFVPVVPVVPVAVMASESSGLSLLQKFLIFGVIAGGMAIWMRSGRGHVAERSHA